MQHHTLFSYENIKFSVHGENFKENLVLKKCANTHTHIYKVSMCYRYKRGFNTLKA